MENWLKYLKERFPLPVYFLLVGGMCLAGQVPGNSDYGIARLRFDAFGFLWSFIGLMLFFALLRLMDEYKDYEKDIVAHPTRPLPRGLLTADQVKQAINRVAIGMVFYAVAVGFALNWVAGGLYLFLTAYLWLMFKEFYLGAWLVARPILYAITHQVVLIPICLFAAATSTAKYALGPYSILYGVVVLGSFFSYEVCRKLDPKAHPLLKTYLFMYGARGVVGLVLPLNVLAAFAAHALGLGMWLWPCEVLVAVSLILLFVAPQKYKLVEAAATLSLFFHIWALVFQSLLQSGVHP